VVLHLPSVSKARNSMLASTKKWKFDTKYLHNSHEEATQSQRPTIWPYMEGLGNDLSTMMQS
jgi:hypothetical protein